MSKNNNLKKRLAAVEQQEAHKDATKERSYPPGWEPGVTWDGTKGEITTNTVHDDPNNPNNNWDELLASRGLNPDLYQIVGNTIRWTSYDGWKRDNPGDEAYSTICYSYKAEIMLKTSETTSNPIPEEVYQAIRSAKKPKKQPPGGDTHFVVALSDWQTGNRDGGGVEEQAEKIANLVEAIPERIQTLRDAGHNIGHAIIAGLGDLVEGTCGHYPAQQFRVDLDRREQIKLVRRGLRDIIAATAPTVKKLTVVAIAGNHGENRQNGKAITSTGDNDDVAVFEQVAEIFAANKKTYGHIGFKLPLDELTLSIEAAGHIIAFTHGHLAKGNANAAQAIWNWWTKQAMGRAHQGVADADLLIAGHYHHLNIKEQEGRALIIAPSLTAVGEYFQDSAGVKTRPGTLNLTINKDGWNNLHLIT
jgi:predicted phosphodiesterase